VNNYSQERNGGKLNDGEWMISEESAERTVLRARGKTQAKPGKKRRIVYIKKGCFFLGGKGKKEKSERSISKVRESIAKEQP